MRKSVSILLLLLALALLSTPFSTNAQPGRTLTIFLYAAKFVCGRSGDNAIVAPGQYFTAINVHNASPTTAVRYIKRFAIALQEERPGKISEFVLGSLGPDEAMGIDCANIYKHTGTAPGSFLEGYALLYSLSELDVVSIHTAGPREVETLHTERVPVRKLVLGRQTSISRRMLEQ
jgi:hypothetical protein